ncbi:MAG TPA: TonB family protein [Lacunisphaera sp.]|jgi:RNA polymerase sigma factor (sigma-70 family)
MKKESMKDDATLLRNYAGNRSESDFAELVRRHVNLVYSSALRQVNGNTHLAQDVTQSVFIDLARKAASLAKHEVLAGWLFTSTRFAATKLMRGEQRRWRREQEAETMQTISRSNSSDSLDWERVRPVIDEALAELSERDREAILLRYLEGYDFGQVGAKLSLSDNAARMRVDRAIDKLRTLLARRGVTSSTAALSFALSSQAVIAAPAGLVAVVTGAALSAGGGAAATLTFMSLTKLQIAVAGAVLVVGAGAYLMQDRNNDALRAELAGIPPPTGEIAELQESNRQLVKAAHDVSTLRVSDAEFARLRAEAAEVQNRIKENRATALRTAAVQQSLPIGKTYDISQLDQKPKLVRPIQPIFPYKMSQAGISGEVTVEFSIGPDGKVMDARVLRSSDKEFEASALATVSKWQFTPGQKDGQSVITRASQLIKYSLSTTSNDPQNNPPSWF